MSYFQLLSLCFKMWANRVFFCVIWNSDGIQRNATGEINENSLQHTSQSMDLKNSWLLMSSIPFSPTPSENKFQRVRKHISCIMCAQENIHIHLNEGYSKKEGSLSLNEHLNQNWKFNKVLRGASSRYMTVWYFLGKYVSKTLCDLHSLYMCWTCFHTYLIYL